jgi:hypothetical protein
LAGILGTILGAVIGVVGTLIGTKQQAKGEAKARQDAAATFIAAAARPIAVSLLEAKQSRAMPIDGFDPILGRFTAIATSRIATELSPSRITALVDVLRNTELAVRHVNRCWSDAHREAGAPLTAAEREKLYVQMQAAADDGVANLKRFLHLLGDDDEIKPRFVDTP